MLRIFRFLKLPGFVFGLFATAASAESPSAPSERLGFPSVQMSFLSAYAAGDEIEARFVRPVGSTFYLDLGPKVIELKTSYMERPEEPGAFDVVSNDAGRRRYFDLLATSSRLDGKLVGEAELAYTRVDAATTADEDPKALRLGVKGQWGSTFYGADYKSIGSGFVSLTGARADHARDEAQVWGEHNFGLLGLRASLGESRERTADTNEARITRTAAASLHLRKPNWSARLTFTYSTEQEPGLKQKTASFTNVLSTSYQAASVVKIEPNVGIKEKWDESTGVRTQTPSAGLVLTSAPSRNLQLNALAAYESDISEDGSMDISKVNTLASLNWRIGKPVIGEELLSFKVEYTNQLDFNSARQSENTLAGMLQLKIIGF